MSNSVELSRKFLSDAGGWKEMKPARSLHSMGRVTEASYSNGLLEGIVREGEKSLKVRMRINSRTDLENLCPCFRARRDGMICAHALAVGLEFLKPTEKKDENKASNGRAAEKIDVPVISDAWPVIAEVPSDESVIANLFLILSPNFISAWDKGQITVGTEIEINGERKLLKALGKKAPLYLFPHDVALYRVLQTISPETVPGMMVLGQEDFVRILNAVPGHPGITFGKNVEAPVSYQALRLPLKRAGKNSLLSEWPPDAQPLVTKRGIWVLADGKGFHPVAPGLPTKYLPVFVGGYQFEASSLEADLDIFQSFFDIDQLNINRETPLIRLEIEGSLNHLDACLSFDYPALDTNEDAIQLGDPAAEQLAVNTLDHWGFSQKGSQITKFVLKDSDAILRFFAYGFSRLEQNGWEITTGERFDHASQKVEPVSGEMEFHSSSGENWFAMDVSFSTASGDLVSRQEIQRILQMGQNSKKLSNGKIAVLDTDMLDEFADVLTDCEPDQLQPGTYQIDSAHGDYLRETASDFGFSTKGDFPGDQKTGKLVFQNLPADLSSILRPYQQTGIEWMQSLAQKGRGGILGDDMGLGKTLQTLAYIQAAGGSALVICPSSLVFNWVAEAGKFVPDLKVLAIEGPNRASLIKGNRDADILITSYALFRRDEDLYRDCEFTTIVIDEAQHIKNPDAKISKAIHRLSGRNHFALTGTPIENSVRDLWSILQFASPGYLGSRKDFAQRFEKPLGGSSDSTSVQRRLSRRLRPVILRRLKREVASDLPEKIEQVIYCDLNPTQREVYAKILRESREMIFDAEGGRKRMLALTALLRLRQTCCDLRLLGLADIEPEKASVKSEVLEEILNEAVEGQHRVLVFSQFVEMLQILVPVLAEKGINFCYLDGKTKNRGEVVTKFQENEEITVFLISLKAGGVGLNLTGADTVIHIDPWWNPAVEAQATDRAHRIGQTRVVNSYKLIARDTVEEKILSLQNRKRELSENLLDGGAGIRLGDAGLSEDELMSFFE